MGTLDSASLILRLVAWLEWALETGFERRWEDLSAVLSKQFVRGLKVFFSLLAVATKVAPAAPHEEEENKNEQCGSSRKEDSTNSKTSKILLGQRVGYFGGPRKESSRGRSHVMVLSVGSHTKGIITWELPHDSSFRWIQKVTQI